MLVEAPDQQLKDKSHYIGHQELLHVGHFSFAISEARKVH